MAALLLGMRLSWPGCQRGTSHRTSSNPRQPPDSQYHVQLEKVYIFVLSLEVIRAAAFQSPRLLMCVSCEEGAVV